MSDQPDHQPTISARLRVVGAWLNRWWRMNPLTVLGLAAVTGVIMADWLGLKLSPLLLVALAVAFWFGWRRRTLLNWLPFVFAAFMTLHGWHLRQTFFHPLREQLLSMPDRPHAVGVKARLYPWAEGAEIDEARAIGEITELRWGSSGRYKPVSAQITIALPHGFRLTEPGVHELEGKLSLPRSPQNPGQFDPAGYGLRMGCVALVQAHSVRLLKPEPWSPGFHLLRWAEASRQWISKALALGIETREQDTAVLLAMALGASDAAGEDIEDAFRDSGTLHIFAVSGLHVVMLAAVAAFLLRWLGVGKSRAVGWLIVIVFGYAYITGWRPSAARAAFMIAMVLIAPWWNRKSCVQNSLGAAVLILLAYDTHQLFQPGFQLSFLVLWSIAFFAAPMLSALNPWTELDPFLPPQLASRRQRLSAWSRQFLASLSCVSAAAWIGSLPLTLGHFRTVTPVGLVANLLLVPISGFSITASCVSVCCAAVGFSTGQVLANIANAWLARLMVMLATWFSSLPLANFTLDLRFEKEPPPVELQVFHLPGGGASSHLRAGDSQWLIDTGNVRAWRGVLRPFFRRQGINHLDGVILTHGDIAHVGAADLAYQFGAPRLHTSVHEPWLLDPSFVSMQRLADKVPVDSLGWHRHHMEDVIEIQPAGPLHVSATVLHPMLSDRSGKADDRGLVLMMQIAGMRVLWLGDAGFITEKKLLERHVPLACDILIRGQHSADISGMTELLIAAHPQVIISSNDSRYPEETLPQRVRDYCTKQKIQLFDLEVCGSVNIGVTPSGMKVKAFRNGQEAVITPATR